jgi:uncharacterized protein YijF (DUF1287 family)
VKKHGKGTSRSRTGVDERASTRPRASAMIDPAAAGEALPSAELSSANAARLPVGLSWHTVNSPRRPTAVHALGDDERRNYTLMMLPLLMAALSLGFSQTMKQAPHLSEIARLPDTLVAAPQQPGSMTLPPLTMPAGIPPLARAMERVAPPHGIALQPPPTIELPARSATLIMPPPALALPQQAPVVTDPEAAKQAPVPEAAIATNPFVCTPAPKRAALASVPAAADFGVTLARAAAAQTAEFVIYSAAYKRIAYPKGDIPSLYGSCSDLVIRAYRDLGVDLQELVQRARSGRGDPNIDHRRTETLRAFFVKHGENLPVSSFGEDYKPGDVVTYYRPYSRVSRAHIAIVSETIGPSGRPLIVHNRGWGPQLEDALFVDRITGHYRFTGAPHLMATAGRGTMPVAAGTPPSFAVPSARTDATAAKARRADASTKPRQNREITAN